jgi:hemolysin activation/secretion protein
VLGANYNHYGIQQKIGDREKPLVNAFSNFLVPFVGTTLSRNFSWGAISGGVRFDHTLGDLVKPNTNRTTGILALGRGNVDADWTSGRWNLNGTVYLDQLFRGDKEGPLAHEVSLRTKGRVLLRGERLIPHEQEPLGGALSVRGYSESTLSADEFTAGTIEYAFHIPRALKPGAEGKFARWPFKWRPKQAGGNPDWDLVLRGFYDYAYRSVNPPPLAVGETEADRELTYIDKSFAISGAGFGISLTVKQNFSLRCDYGMALTQLRDDDQPAGEEILVPKGNKEIYIVTSFSW